MVTGRDPMMGETRTCACAPSASAVAGPNQRTTIKARGHPIRFYEAGPMTAPRPTSRQDVEKVLAMWASSTDAQVCAKQNETFRSIRLQDIAFSCTAL